MFLVFCCYGFYGCQGCGRFRLYIGISENTRWHSKRRFDANRFAFDQVGKNLELCQESEIIKQQAIWCADSIFINLQSYETRDSTAQLHFFKGSAKLATIWIHHRFPHFFLRSPNLQLPGKSGKSKGGRKVKGRGKGQPVEGEETLGDEELEDWAPSQCR